MILFWPACPRGFPSPRQVSLSSSSSLLASLNPISVILGKEGVVVVVVGGGVNASRAILGASEGSKGYLS